MIRRLYVDNFRSLVDFTWEPGMETLVLGNNGSGKTSAVEVLSMVRDWATGRIALNATLTSGDWTSWAEGNLLRFDVDLFSEDRLYQYVVSLALNEDGRPFVWSEQLKTDEGLVFYRNQEYVSDQSPQRNEMKFPIARDQSVLNVIGNASFGREAITFRRAFEALICVKPEPSEIRSIVATSSRVPNTNLENLLEWQLFLHEEGSFLDQLSDLLKDGWPDLLSIGFVGIPRSWNQLSLLFDSTKSDIPPQSLDVDQLSDGERMLLGLYTLATYQKSRPPTTIIIDEPDNFVSLAELQPWLLTMLDTRPDDGQLILISHNPRIIETMGYEQTDYFVRDDHLSPTRVRKIRPDETGLSLSERVARGWLDE